MARTALASELAQPLIDSWWTVVAGVCLGLAVGIGAFGFLPKEYRATATLTGGAAGGAATLRETARSSAILEQALERAGGETGDREAASGRLRRRISAADLPAAGEHGLTVAAGDPAEAARLTNALAEALSASGGPYRLLVPAEPPSRPTAPRQLEVCLLGVAIGLVIFVGFPLVRSAIDPVICSEAAVETVTGAPALVCIPRVSTEETRGDSRRRRLLNTFLSVLSAAVLAAVVLATRTL